MPFDTRDGLVPRSDSTSFLSQMEGAAPAAPLVPGLQLGGLSRGMPLDLQDSSGAAASTSYRHKRSSKAEKTKKTPRSKSTSPNNIPSPSKKARKPPPACIPSSCPAHETSSDVALPSRQLR